MKKQYENYWGIDVSKEWLDIDTGNEVIRIRQTKAAIKAFVKKHRGDSKKILAVLESTGGYERLAVSCLLAQSIKVHIAHPNKVNAFARAKGRLAKTDRIDAKIIRSYALFIEDKEIKALPSAIENELSLLSARLEQLKSMHHQESCRLGMACEKVKDSIKNVLNLLKEQIESVKEAMLKIIHSDAELKEKYEILCSMKGVGSLLAMRLLADLPELGKANKKEIAALVGVAPLTRESGRKIGKAMIQYGRFNVRKVLYMGALVASRHEPKFRDFYVKLTGGGKAPKVALVAVMRKMIVVLNEMVRSKKPFYA